jgi:1-acyl-sn-glycerol-3-phosphate acyltransferase
VTAVERGRIFDWYNRELGKRWGTSPDDYQPEAVRETVRRLRWLFGERRYFRLEVRGIDQMPPAPTLVVSNHSGGTTIPDVWGFGVLWYRAFSADRPLHLMAHDMILATAATRRFFGRRGVLRGSRGLAESVLTEWRRDLMVMPGGDLDTWRPYSQRYEVRFGGRLGYARLALRAGVPIVPVANAGAHETLMVLSDGRRLARALRLPQLARASIWPVHLSLPWGVAVGPWPHLPLPVRLRYRLGAPIQLADQPLRDPPDDLVRELDERVRRAIQDQLHALRDEAG